MPLPLEQREPFRKCVTDLLKNMYPDVVVEINWAENGSSLVGKVVSASFDESDNQQYRHHSPRRMMRETLGPDSECLREVLLLHPVEDRLICLAA